MRFIQALIAIPAATVVLLGAPLASAAEVLPYVQVSAQGEVKAKPDHMVLNLSINATEKTLSRAKSKVDKGFRHAMRVAASLNIPESDIDAARINNYPQYRWHDGTRSYQGEQVSRDMHITLHNMEQYGELVNKLMKENLIQVNNTEFRFSDRTKLEHQALQQALLAARQKATLMAETMEMTLGTVLVMTEGHSQMPQPMYHRMEAMAMADSPRAKSAPMLVQEQTINSRVEVRFQLK